MARKRRSLPYDPRIVNGAYKIFFSGKTMHTWRRNYHVPLNYPIPSPDPPVETAEKTEKTDDATVFWFIAMVAVALLDFVLFCWFLAVWLY